VLKAPQNVRQCDCRAGVAKRQQRSPGKPDRAYGYHARRVNDGSPSRCRITEGGQNVPPAAGIMM